MSTVKKDKLIFTLSDVWYVPEVLKNLFSVLAAQNKNRTNFSNQRLRIARSKLMVRYCCVEPAM